MPRSHDLQLHVPSRLRGVLTCLVAMALLCLMAAACSVPVFRYGLEHWKADPYRLLVVHRGALRADAQGEVKRLREAATQANVEVTTADLETEPAADVKLAWEAAGSPAEPSLIVLAPTAARAPGIVWAGPLNADTVSSALDSPARKTIATGLREGESAVWVLLESGDKAADDAAASLLEARLNYLGTVMELPKLDEQDIRNGLVSVPPEGLQLSFSIVRVSRVDPAEKVFVPMLLSTEPDLREIEGPMAFPVFGQGRALYALVGKGIKHETIDEAAAFLIGSCSCQIKEKNPGADLLMAVDWKGLLRDQATGLADLPAASEIAKSLPDTVTIAPQPEAKGVVGSKQDGTVHVDHLISISPTAVVSALAVAGLLIAAGAIVMMKRRGR